MRRPVLGCIAGDFTGATDLASTLVRGGMRVVQTIGVPATALDEATDAIVAAYAARGIRLHAVMLSRLGPTVWHDDPASASAVLEELEETARLALLAGDEAEPLDAGHVQELREIFDAQW